MSRNIDIKIGKKLSGSELSDTSINYLRTKITILNGIYNIILKHLCLKKNIDRTHDLLTNIRIDLNASYPNLASEFCLDNNPMRVGPPVPRPGPGPVAINAPGDIQPTAGGPPTVVQLNAIITAHQAVPANPRLRFAVGVAAVGTWILGHLNTTLGWIGYREAPGGPYNDQLVFINNYAPPTFALGAVVTVLPTPPVIGPVVQPNCHKQMFDDNRLLALINSMYVDGFLNKACMYRNVTGDYNINVQVGGYKMPLLNIENILGTQDESGSNTNNNFSIICIKINGKLQCSNTNSRGETSNSCEFCEKWIKDRAIFKSVLNDMLNESDINSTMDLMTQSVDLLPSAILGQKQYHDFMKAIEQYKESRRA
jgi:hypothetical protein